ncbi:MAG: hypothetical protein AAGD04_15950, partial [Pseudomonadota bacterium]
NEPGVAEAVEDAKRYLEGLLPTTLSTYQPPLEAFCRANCSENVGACLVVGDARLARAAPFPMRSPSEALISEDTYWNSARMDRDIARRVASLAGPKVDLSMIDMCFDETAARLSE